MLGTDRVSYSNEGRSFCSFFSRFLTSSRSDRSNKQVSPSTKYRREGR